jgi:1-acyl-sn-glycerol-3-phosphate acyltransferase
MIYRTVKKRFRNVYWKPVEESLRPPVLFVPNHHGWHDGYLLFHLVLKLGLPTLDWIQEFDAFPLFRTIGGLPFPINDSARRYATIRESIRQLNDEGKSLIVFAEGVLHPGPDILPFGRGFEVVAKHVHGIDVRPVAIVYRMGIHERPEAALSVGASVPLGPGLVDRTRDALIQELKELRSAFSRDDLELLVPGTPDVNERMDMRQVPRFPIRKRS